MINNKAKVVFIDENPSERDKFEDYVYDYENLQTNVIHPKETPEKIVEYVIENEIDAIVCDFDLREKEPSISYQGDEVIEAMLNVKPNFPVFIFTSHEDDALIESKSVHYVYDKKLMNDPQKKFLKKIVDEITKYKEQIESWKAEFAALRLRQINNEQITDKEVERLIELDTFLDKSINQKTSIAKQVKEDQKLGLNLLIKNTEEILNTIKTEFKKDNDESN